MCKKNNEPSFYCKKCNFKLNKKVKVCPQCGCNNKLVKMNVGGELIVRGTLQGLKYILGKKGWVKEVISGWFSSGDKNRHPKGVKKIRVIDRENPENTESYQEKITDVETGKIIRDIKEPLKKHKHK